jgi:ribosomal-protein-alanine N-acetyltransferase
MCLDVFQSFQCAVKFYLSLSQLNDYLTLYYSLTLSSLRQRHRQTHIDTESHRQKCVLRKSYSRTQSNCVGRLVELLEGNNVNLRIVEKEDVPLAHEWMNDPKFTGEFIGPIQMTREEFEKTGSSSPFAMKGFFIEKKDGTKIGLINHFTQYLGMGELLEIGYMMAPNERGKGYCTEAVQLMVDYLFLSKDISRIQITLSLRNKASKRVAEKAGFTREGIIRKTSRGARRDAYLYRNFCPYARFR